MLTGRVCEWYFLCFPALGMNSDENFRKNIEIPGIEREVAQDMSPVEAKITGQVGHGQAKTAAEKAIEDPTEELSAERHPGAASGHVTRSDNYLTSMAPQPQVADKRRGMGEIRVHGHDIFTDRRAEAAQNSATKPTPRLLDHSGPDALGGVGSLSVSVTRDDQDLRTNLEALQYLAKLGQQDSEI